MRSAARPDPLAAVNVLELRPVRLAEWEERDGRVVLHRPEPRTRGLRGVRDRVLHQLAARRVRLDPIGTVAWLALDGSRTVAEVAELLRLEYGEAVAPAEERVGRLIRVLRREGFLAYADLDSQRPPS